VVEIIYLYIIFFFYLTFIIIINYYYILGKWHLGGMREEFRKSRVYEDKCDNPGPNQHGFEEYTSALDGPESPRYTFLMKSCLHSLGHRHRIKDDIPVPIIHPIDDEPNVLSIREAEDAIQMMKDNKINRPDQPWLIQVWFNAPHGPWELLKKGEDVYTKHHNVSESYWANIDCDSNNFLQKNTPWKYKSMLSAMDISIGMLLDAVKELGYEDNTLIVFTSDNGPETSAGTSGPYKEGKRSLMEGGIRVPAIFQWVGHIPPNTVINSFGTLTDLYPTFVEAAELHKDISIHMDGISLLPYLLPNHVPIKLHHKHGNILVTNNSSNSYNNFNSSSERNEISSLEMLANRIFLWHKDTGK
jgi:arylsulfatase A-like enzyme